MISLKTFAFHGVDVTRTNGSKQVVTQCPFCGKERHFYIAATEDNIGQFSCKRCGEKGNAYSFLEKTYEFHLNQTNKMSLIKLARLRGTSSSYYSKEIAYDKYLGRYLLPVRNQKGNLVNLKVYEGENFYNTTGCSAHIWGIEKVGPSGNIFLCEGEWDGLALQYLFSKFESTSLNYVLAVPGADTILESDLTVFEGHKVYLLYDHDEAGYKGMKRASEKIAQAGAEEVLTICWPDAFPRGYDVEDYVKENYKNARTAVRQLKSWCLTAENLKSALKTRKLPKREHFHEVLKDFKKTGIQLHQSLEDALIVTLATCLSGRLQGEPLWTYIIGAPGIGKSMVIESTMGSDNVVYRTSLTPQAFVSGFRGEDHSIMAQVMGKCLAVKDWSNILSLSHTDLERLTSLLREAYDGYVHTSYGNFVHRQYPPPDSELNSCHFSFIAGATPDIHIIEDTLGNRFLKCAYYNPKNPKNLIRDGIDNNQQSHKDYSRKLTRQDSVTAFLLSREVDLENLPEIPPAIRDKIASLAHIVSYCRSHIKRNKEGDALYEAFNESSIRVGKQLGKLTQSLTILLNLDKPNEEVYRIVSKVAYDTAYGFKRAVFIPLFKNPEGLTPSEISTASGLSSSTVGRVLTDLMELEAVTRRKSQSKGSGKIPYRYRLHKDALESFKESSFGDSR